MKKSELLYIGGYTGQNPHCLYVYNHTSPEMDIEELYSYEITNASYLCFSPNRQYLYAVIEVESYKNRAGGGVAAFAVEDDGQLRFINDRFTEGGSPCHLSVSPDGKTLYVANYNGGSTAIFDLLPTGEIGHMKALVNHNDFGPASNAVAGRQEGPHAHYVQPVYINGNSTIWVCDLGLDAVLVLDESGKELTTFQAPAGFGPRHLAFHPALPIAYLVGEFACAVITLEFSFDTTLCIKASHEVPVLHRIEGNAEITCAAIRVSPDCKHLLVSNRISGEEGSISILGLNTAGHITGLQRLIPSGGCCPRDFAFSPAGNNVFIAHQDSDSVNVFDWSEEEMLTPTGTVFEVQKPTCVLFG